MLHDLYLLSCYFDPAQAAQYEEDLRRRYGADAVQAAMDQGWIERICPPCARLSGKFICRLSCAGMEAAARAA
jgi:hypothetical protein